RSPTRAARLICLGIGLVKPALPDFLSRPLAVLVDPVPKRLLNVVSQQVEAYAHVSVGLGPGYFALTLNRIRAGKIEHEVDGAARFERMVATNGHASAADIRRRGFLLVAGGGESYGNSQLITEVALAFGKHHVRGAFQNRRDFSGRQGFLNHEIRTGI